MIINWLVPLLFLLTLDPSKACHRTNIFIKNGTWCCGMGEHFDTDAGDMSFEIVGDDSVSDFEITGDQQTAETPQSPQISSPEKNVTGEKPGKPVGGVEVPIPDISVTATDCACGRTAMSKSETMGGRVLGHRPWLGRLSSHVNDNTKVYCSAVLITRSWFLSAAHCFCIAISCIKEEAGKRVPIRLSKSSNDNSLLSKFKVRFGIKENDEEIVELRIHSQYTEEPGEGPDVGLAETSTKVYVPQDGYGMVPICLTFGTGTSKTSEEDNPYLNDMDCEFIKSGQHVNYPEKVASTTSFLSCNPGQFIEAYDVNFIEKRSHMTAYGGGNGTTKCTTNSYGPKRGILSYCQDKCTYESNPTMAYDICKKAEDAGLFLQEVNPQFNLDGNGMYLNEEYHDVAWVKIINKNSEFTCYTDDADVGSLDDFPYRHGWCNVSSDGSWGWCSPNCHAGNWETNIHEQDVNSFIYDKCAPKVYENGLEACVSTPVVNAYGKVYEVDDDGEFHFVENVLRQSHQEIDLKVEGDEVLKEPCYGDVGGAVWKYMVQKVERAREKLASLTGIITRFEKECGAFTEHPDKDGRQNIVMIRIHKILPWIKQQVSEVKKCYDFSIV